MTSHDVRQHPIPRRAAVMVQEALRDTPVVVLQGARQVGKSTLASHLLDTHPGRLLTLDDETLLAAASLDPATFVNSAQGGLLVIDEVQLEPRLLPAVKAAVDRNREPGRYLLTGSANLLTLPGIQESLAGRAETVPLYGFSQGELQGTADALAATLLAGDEQALAGQESDLARGDYLRIAEAGGYPEAVARTGARRAVWFDNYVTRILSRDAGRLSSLQRLDVLPMLLRVLAANSAGELVKARVAADVGLPDSTLGPYLELLESLHLIHLLPPWGRNLRQRVVGRSKAALLDTGLACRLAGLSAEAMDLTAPNAARAGAILETLVAAELRKQQGWSAGAWELRHFRERSGIEVDLVLETPARAVAGIEVKASASVDARDFRGLAHLAELAGDRFTMGAVLHTGPRAIRFQPRMWALPLASLWQ